MTSTGGRPAGPRRRGATTGTPGKSLEQIEVERAAA